MKRILLYIIVLSLLFSVSCNVSDDDISSSVSYIDIPNETEPVPTDTLKIGCSALSGNFNPFYASYDYDKAIVDITSVSLVTFDFDGNVVYDAANNKSVENSIGEREFVGISNINSFYDEDGFETLEISIRKDVKFSDGSYLDIDDVIFSMYVLADPKYDGPSSFNTLPIVGMKEYRHIYDTFYQIIIDDSKSEKENIHLNKLYTVEQYEFCVDAFNKAGETYIKKIIEYSFANYKYQGVKTISDVAALRGLMLEDDADENDFWCAVVDKYNANIDDISSLFKTVSFEQLFYEELDDRAEEFSIRMRSGKDISSISGIEKIDSHSMKIYLNGVDYDLYDKLSIIVAPLHYYGSDLLYDYDSSKFGFEKGKLDFLTEKTSNPLGAGPYSLISYKDGAVKLERNEYYFNGTPNSRFVEFIEIEDDEKIEAVFSGEVHLTTVVNDASVSEKLKKLGVTSQNSAAVKEFGLCNNAYGYIGISANKVFVGDDKSSMESKYLRKAFATMFSAYKYDGIESYFGSDISIEYPINSQSLSYPRIPTFAFSEDSKSQYIYYDGMSALQRYEAALNTAIEFFVKSGYIYDEAEGKLVSPPDGASLAYDILIPLDANNATHPSYKIAVDVKYALSTVGITLNISVPNSIDEFWAKVYDGECAIWAAGVEYSSEISHMLKNYHSSHNKFGLCDEQLDKILEDLPRVSNSEFRNQRILECFNILRDWAVEVPLYDSNDLLIINSNFIDMKLFENTSGQIDVCDVIDRIIIA